VVALRPLDLGVVQEYLLTSTTRTVQVEGRPVPKWQPVLDWLANEDMRMVRQTLSTPLMVVLARMAYSDTRADPAELLDTSQFPTRDSVEHHLLDRLVPAAYGSLDEPGRRIRWRAEHAVRWLSFLARRMNAEATEELAWWRLGGRVARYAAAGAVLLLVGGLAVALARLGFVQYADFFGPVCRSGWPT
jgi:hypothetical protein